MAQTSVEWLFETMAKTPMTEWYNVLEQAKEMHKAEMHKCASFWLGHLMRDGILPGSQLNPQFVLEMMGFPTDWTELPFLNGETSQLKQQGTQSSHK